MGDLLTSLAALVSGITVWAIGWYTVDPALSFTHRHAHRLFQPQTRARSVPWLMEGVPLHLSLEEIGVAMATVEGVTSVHDLHVWSLTAERVALSAHVVIGALGSWPEP